MISASDTVTRDPDPDYLRLISPVRVGSRIRGKFDILKTHTDDKERTIVKFGCEIEGGERPALVARWLSIVDRLESRPALCPATRQ